MSPHQHFAGFKVGYLPTRRGIAIAALLFAVVFFAAPRPAMALSTADFLSSLSAGEADEFQAWRRAQAAHGAKTDDYWDQVNAKRNGRKKKRSTRTPFERSDYVWALPPAYKGPSLSAGVRKKYARFLDAQKEGKPEPPREVRDLAEYLAAARRVYGFVPERVSEAEFKRRYAAEAIALGLSKDQVVRVYALETGGIGTYDMQAGIHPIKKTGRAISSALGYAQLLDANSINELAQHGSSIIARLSQMARQGGISEKRRTLLLGKISAVKKMYANVKRVPYEWSRHQAYAKTETGMGVHALNVDGDIGPMLQAVKLKGLKDFAAKTGRMSLTGGEMELMNLSGPATGLEMMAPPGQQAPTTNFFARRAYYVNKMVIGLTGEGLLAELNRRMDVSIKTPGSQEFAAAFDAVSRGRSAAR